MELYVERQYIAQMKSGDLKQFLLLFDACFEKLYGYNFRRVFDVSEAEKITRLTFLDALAQVQNTPIDIAYEIWLYSLAKTRVWKFINKASFPEKRGVISAWQDDKKNPEKEDLVQRAQAMMVKLSLEEREILRLKYFEDLPDGSIAMVLGADEASIGAKVYRVLKRASFLLFGERADKKGTYFGELSGLLSRVKALEKIEPPRAFKLGLRMDIGNRIEKRDLAIDAELVEEKEEQTKKTPFEKVGGSDDPAKIFVEAVKEMRDEAFLEEERVEERRENIYAMFDRWKAVLLIVPVVLFVVVGMFVTWNLGFFDWVKPWGGPILRENPTQCKVTVSFAGEFSAPEKQDVNKQIAEKLCEHYSDIKQIAVNKKSADKVDVSVDIKDWNLEYRYVKRNNIWQIEKYAKTPGGDVKSGEV